MLFFQNIGLDKKWRANWAKLELFSSTVYLLVIPNKPVLPLYKSRSFVHQKYVVEGLSLAQIAAEIFSSKEAVRASLKRFDIPIREAHNPHNGRVSEPRYGVKLRSGRATPHLAEQQMIESIQELRSQGLTLRKIAEILTSMGVPTKKRGKRWHPEMVNRILSN
ncbi:MAG: recombinase family protein [Bdellovibrionales bacterium]|nr:recombinase family protein [Bdellovibrionales bacterium]